MDYSQKTQALIERMCENVEREDFILDKKNAKECLMKTYDLFNLKRPKKIVWFNDIFNKKWICIAWSARSAGSARSAWSAWSAGSARSARSAWSAWSARSAWSAWSARSAGSAGSARSAVSAVSALDHDFDWFIFEYEYCESPDKEFPINANDTIYLEYCELLMQAKEYGMGYRIEHEGILYCVPTPLVKIDSNNRFHSENSPAIRWKNGEELNYLHGVYFGKELFDKVVQKTITIKDIFALQNIEQRMIALKYFGTEKLLETSHAFLLDSSSKGNQLYVIPKESNIFSQEEFFLKYTCPSTGRVYVKSIEPDVGKEHDADFAQASTFVYPMPKDDGIEIRKLTKKEYLEMQLQS